MIRAIFIFLMCSALKSTWACSCTEPTIEMAYKAAEVIFIGRCDGITTLGSHFGFPMEFVDFEVLNFFKGPDLDWVKTVLAKEAIAYPTVSIRRKSESSCWMDFDRNAYYLIYANKTPDGLFTITDGCTRNREIKPEELQAYMSDSTTLPEPLLLRQLFQQEFPEEYDWDPYQHEEFVHSALYADAQEKINHLEWWLVIVLAVALAIIAIVLFAFVRYRRQFKIAGSNP